MSLFLGDAGERSATDDVVGPASAVTPKEMGGSSGPLGPSVGPGPQALASARRAAAVETVVRVEGARSIGGAS